MYLHRMNMGRFHMVYNNYNVYQERHNSQLELASVSEIYSEMLFEVSIVNN